ncbi:RagB/SusD family nutrient uptake outer membrane protein [Chondrinema litorale]|uniref:RagB/SusD family nutrient uptake outer membrane protein n=1 Tax=Chondrinema litorale TaxID=2994555 RepID=UPI0025435717|nr:RagB/SusD family nutrient uptake outer membrane protein [Chondrinema litorale]UZR94551.1 RagB/SusD family nutrient uptake outer membrane protein [Chondrinema litorale]
MKNKNIKVLLITSFLGVFTSCSEDYLEPSLEQAATIDSGISTSEEAASVVNGTYDILNDYQYYGREFVVYGSVRSDDAFSNANSGRFDEQGNFNLTSSNTDEDDWAHPYQVIANANLVINAGLEDDAEINHTVGQAYALRALAHMDLLKFFGQQYVSGSSNLGVPYITENATGVSYPERNTIDEVWQYVGDDLNTALELMSEDLNASTPIELTTWGVYGILSRFYLFTEDYDNLIEVSEKILNSGEFSIISESGVISSWESGDVTDNSLFELNLNSQDASSTNSIAHIYQEGSYGDVEVTGDLYDIYEDSDIRKSLLALTVEGTDTTYRMVGKYPNSLGTDNIKVIRYEEIILNYVEALYATGSTSQALEYLNMIPENRGASTYTEVTEDNILLERRKELAMEGHRFFDLMRYGRDIEKVDDGQLYSTITYGDTRLVFPIPISEVNANSSMVQNDGY